MKRILFALMAVLLAGCFWSCSDDDEEGRNVSFRRPYYILPASEPLKVEIRLSEPAASQLVIPFEVGGTAEEGREFEVSAHEFTVAPGQDTAFVEIRPLNNMRQGTEIRLELQHPAGYAPGLYRQTIIPVEVKTAFTSYFYLTDLNLYEEMEFGIKLFVGSKEYKYPSYDLNVPFEIDPSSTAVLGTHYEIVGGKKECLYQKDDFLARARIRFLKKEAGKDRIVLRLVDNDNFLVGLNNDRAYIDINGPVSFKDLEGSWKFEEFSSRSYIDHTASMAGDKEGVKNLPECSADDILTFEDRGGKHVVNTTGLGGDLKDYFCDGAEVKVEDIISDQIYNEDDKDEWGILREILKTRFSKVNLSFSPEHRNFSDAEVDFRLLGAGDGLEVRIVEYIPTDFLQETYAYYSAPDYSGDKYFNKALPMKGKFTITMRFSKVK